MLTVFH